MRGYVLFLTLILLSLTAVAVADVCRRNLGHALASVQAEQELQRRWGIDSCRKALLPRLREIAHRKMEAGLTLGGHSATRPARMSV